MAKLVLKVGNRYALKGYTGKTEYDLRFLKGIPVDVSDDMTIKPHLKKDDGAEKVSDYLLRQEKYFKDNGEMIKRKVFEKIENEKATMTKHSSTEKED